MALRFECPRCEVSFDESFEAGEDHAHVPCPRCGGPAIQSPRSDDESFSSDATRLIPTKHKEQVEARKVLQADPGPEAETNTAVPPGDADPPSFDVSLDDSNKTEIFVMPEKLSPLQLGIQASSSFSGEATADKMNTLAQWREKSRRSQAPSKMTSERSQEAVSRSSTQTKKRVVAEQPNESFPMDSLATEIFTALDKAFEPLTKQPAAPTTSSNTLTKTPVAREQEPEPSFDSPRATTTFSGSQSIAPPRLKKPTTKTAPKRQTELRLSSKARSLAFLSIHVETPAPKQPAVPEQIVTEDISLSSTLHSTRSAPSMWDGLSWGRMTAMIAGLFIMGGLGGAFLIPQPHAQAPGKREKAQQHLAAGNRFYENGRYDDALGAYRAAVRIDESYAEAHRAKGSALAKQKRYDEAADAYRDYLRLAPEAIDAADVRDILSRHEQGFTKRSLPRSR